MGCLARGSKEQLHTPAKASEDGETLVELHPQIAPNNTQKIGSNHLPNSDHIQIHLLQFIFRNTQLSTRSIDLIVFEALRREADVELLIVFL